MPYCHIDTSSGLNSVNVFSSWRAFVPACDGFGVQQHADEGDLSPAATSHGSATADALRAGQAGGAAHL